MVSKFNIRKVLATAGVEYIKWIGNERMIILIIMYLYIQNTVVNPLLEHSQIMNSPINILEPFIATMNSEAMIIVVPALFLALFSDFPRTDGNTLFFLQRIGRVNWIIGEILFAIYAIVSYIMVIFLFTVLPVFTKGFWMNGWSLVVTQFAKQYPKQSQSFACLLLKSNIYNQVSPFYAAMVSTGLMMLYLLVISLIMLLFNSLKKKIFGILMISGVIAIGSTLFIQDIKAMWAFPVAHIAIKSHFTKFFSEGNVPMWISFVYLFAIIIILVLGCNFCIKRINFESIQEID